MYAMHNTVLPGCEGAKRGTGERLSLLPHTEVDFTLGGRGVPAQGGY